MNQQRIKKLLPAILAFDAILIAGLLFFFPIGERVTTTPDGTPRSHRYEMEPYQVGQFVSTAIQKLGWKTTRQDGNIITADAPVLLGTSKVTVTVQNTGMGAAAIVEITAETPSGLMNKGASAKHIAALQSFMDSKLPQSR
jgi:hypothetical protein